MCGPHANCHHRRNAGRLRRRPAHTTPCCRTGSETVRQWIFAGLSVPRSSGLPGPQQITGPCPGSDPGRVTGTVPPQGGGRAAWAGPTLYRRGARLSRWRERTASHLVRSDGAGHAPFMGALHGPTPRLDRSLGRRLSVVEER